MIELLFGFIFVGYMIAMAGAVVMAFLLWCWPLNLIILIVAALSE